MVASGEQVTSGLLAIVLQSMGVKARSWQGWQIPLMTDDAHRAARITGVDVEELKARVPGGEVAVVAGFQASAPTTAQHLGPRRLGHSAVALAAALSAERCDIYTDVDGVYTTDPRIVPKAQRSRKSPMRKCWRWPRSAPRCCRRVRSSSPCAAGAGAGAVELRSSRLGGKGAQAETVGTLVCHEDEIVEKTGCNRRRLFAGRGQGHAAQDRGQARRRRRGIRAARGSRHQCRHDRAERGARPGGTDLTFTVQSADTTARAEVLKKAKDKIGYEEIHGRPMSPRFR